MDTTATKLASQLVGRLAETPQTDRILVGIAGIPASGKSTFAKLLLAETLRLAPDTAVLVGLDGWHLSRAQLDALPDPQHAHDRRGIHWTFDGSSYLKFATSLHRKVAPDSPIITAPSFDHAAKDPVLDAVLIYPHHRIVFIEGIYPFLSIDPWRQAGMLLDERWLIQVPVETATRRLIKRHVLTGVTKDIEEATLRARENDMPNGQFMLDNMLEPTLVIDSVDDDTLL